MRRIIFVTCISILFCSSIFSQNQNMDDLFGKDLLGGKGILEVPIDYDVGIYTDSFTIIDYLKAGHSYKIELFELRNKQDPGECIMFLKEKDALFLGDIGLFFLKRYRPDIFIDGSYMISFLEKEKLPVGIDNYKLIPKLYRYGDFYKLDYSIYRFTINTEFIRHILLCVSNDFKK